MKDCKKYKSTCMLRRIPRRNHITPVLKDLHSLRINERIKFKILILTHRAFYEAGPLYLSELIKNSIQGILKLTVYAFSQYEYNLYSLLIVSANQFAMCTCIIIALLIYHDVIIQILPSLNMWRDTHIGLKRPHFLTYYFTYFRLSAWYSVNYM